MAIGDPGQEQFRNLIPTCRNHHIAALLQPLMLLRSEIVHSEDLADRGGLDTPSRDHFVQLVENVDRWRRRLTHNPDTVDLGAKLSESKDVDETIKDAANPFGGDDIQMGATSLYDLPWDFSGGDPNIPLFSALEMSDNGRIILSAVDVTIGQISRLNSRDRSHFLTSHDSLRVYGGLQQIFAYLMTFAGDENRVDVAQIPATDEPRGAPNAPNRKTEVSGSGDG